MENLFQVPGYLDGEMTTVLLQNEHLCIEKIVSSPHTQTAWYDQEEDEWVCLLQGEAVLFLDDREVILKAGEWLFIPAHQVHKVADTGIEPVCIWLCIFGDLKDKS